MTQKKTKQTNKLPSFVDRFQILSHKTATYQQVLLLREVLFNFGMHGSQISIGLVWVMCTQASQIIRRAGSDNI
jgi:hypothetical protein